MSKEKLFQTVLFLLFLISNSLVIAQNNFLFENISVANGLSSSQTNVLQTIYQDKFGFMWFGTVDGLNSYDGYKIKVYKNIPGDSLSLPSSNITHIVEDANNNLWIGTNGFMSKLDRNSGKFINYPILINSTNKNLRDVLSALVDSKKNLWIGTSGSGIQKWDSEKKEFKFVPLLLNKGGIDTLVESNLDFVASIVQLKNGNILAATFEHGIFFYNENLNKFVEFNLGGNEQPNAILKITEDGKGNLWLVGKNIVALYNPSTHIFKNFNVLKKINNPPNEIFFSNIQETQKGTFFISSTNGLYELNSVSEKFEEIPILDSSGKKKIQSFIGSMFVDNFGVYWIGTFNNGVYRFDPQRKPFNYFSLGNIGSNQSLILFINSIIPDVKNPESIFLVSNRNGIFRMNQKSKKIENLNIPSPSIYSDTSRIRKIVQDSNNKLWFPKSSTELSSYNIKTRKVESFKIEKYKNSGKEKINITKLPQDKILISSSEGLKIFDTRTKKVNSIKSMANRVYQKELKSDVQTILNTKKEIAAFTKVGEAATLSKTFLVSKKTKVLVVCVGEGQYPTGIFDKGKITGPNDEIVWEMSDLEKTFHDGGGLKNRIQIDVMELNTGNYKLNYQTDIGHSFGNFNVSPPIDSTWYGIQVFEIDEDNYLKLDKMINDENKNKNFIKVFDVDYVLESRKYPGSFWIASEGRGIIKYDINSGIYKEYRIPENQWKFDRYGSFFEDSKGMLWTILNPSGFFRFDPEKEIFTSNTDIKGLPTTAIYSMVEDSDENIWINSSNGVSKLKLNNKTNKWALTQYDSKDGLTNNFGFGSYISHDGEIMMGATNGLITFYPSTENISPPIPVVTNLSLSDISITSEASSYKTSKSIFDIDSLSLKYDENDLSFEFIALHYSRPEKNKVRYKLEGFDNSWKETQRGFVSYTNLEPGDYNLQIGAVSGYGISSVKNKNIRIVISPPWYQTTVAYIGYVLLFLGLIFGIDRFQRRRILSKARERMKIQSAEHRAEAAELQARAFQAESDRKNKELEEARQLQLSMLPTELPQLANLDIAVYMKTATEVGGDYYDFHVGLDGTLTVVLGDATGHGMKAGTMVTSTKSLFNAFASNTEIISTFHEMTRCLKLMRMDKLSMCMTMLKISGNKISMSAAGMPPALLYRSDTRSIDEIVLKGMPLGTFSDFPYKLYETEIFKGDTLLLMSDGFPELMNEEKEMFGYKTTRNSFEEIAEKSPEDIIVKLKNIGSAWTKDKDPEDDITFVVIKVK